MTADAFWTYSIEGPTLPVELPDALRTALTANGSGSTFDDILAASTEAPGLFFMLDAAGRIVRTLHGRTGPLASCHPGRVPDRAMPTAPLVDVLRLSPSALARSENGAICLETPGAWARVIVRDASLLPLLGILAAGGTRDDCCAVLPGHSADTLDTLLQLFEWCDLLSSPDSTAVLEPHDQLMHTRSRLGYGRQPIGKTGKPLPTICPGTRSLAVVRLPDVPEERTPSLDAVLRLRRSIRTYAPEPMTLEQLSRFLFRVLGQRGGRRSFPSGGGCYPLNGYLAIRSCQDVAPGLYVYRPDDHLLAKVAEDGAQLNQLLGEAAAAAALIEGPQMLLILSADFTKIAPVYGGLSYSLVLKEAGAIMQTSMLAAAAAGLAGCPLGTGNSLLFSRLAGLDPARETSVAEMMIGSANLD